MEKVFKEGRTYKFDKEAYNKYSEEFLKDSPELVENFKRYYAELVNRGVDSVEFKAESIMFAANINRCCIIPEWCIEVVKEEKPSTTWVKVVFNNGGVLEDDYIEGEVDPVELIEVQEAMQEGKTTLLYVTWSNEEYAINTANILYIKTIK